MKNCFTPLLFALTFINSYQQCMGLKSKVLYDLNLNKSTYEINLQIPDEAVTDLLQFNSFSQVAILGTARQGKSTLLGMLATGSPSTFETSSSETESHTKGVHYLDQLVEYGNKEAMFLDFEGQDFQEAIDISDIWDAKLSLPSLVTSEVLIYNFGVYNAVDVQKKLEFIVERMIQIVFENQQKLGHLHLVFQNTGADSLKDLTKHLNEKLPDSIRSKFKSVTYWCIPDERLQLENLKDKIFTDASQFSEEYRSIVNSMKEKIKIQLTNDSSKTFNGKEYLILLEHLKTQINSKEWRSQFHIKSIHETILFEKGEALLSNVHLCIDALEKTTEYEDFKKDCGKDFFDFLESEFTMAYDLSKQKLTKKFTEICDARRKLVTTVLDAAAKVENSAKKLQDFSKQLEKTKEDAKNFTAKQVEDLQNEVKKYAGIVEDAKIKFEQKAKEKLDNEIQTLGNAYQNNNLKNYLDFGSSALEVGMEMYRLRLQDKIEKEKLRRKTALPAPNKPNGQSRLEILSERDRNKPMAIEPSIKPRAIEPSIKPRAIEPSIKPRAIKPSIKPKAIKPSIKPRAIKF
eukprot:Pgem_evm1s18011